MVCMVSATAINCTVQLAEISHLPFHHFKRAFIYHLLQALKYVGVRYAMQAGLANITILPPPPKKKFFSTTGMELVLFFSSYLKLLLSEDHRIIDIELQEILKARGRERKDIFQIYCLKQTYLTALKIYVLCIISI